MCIKYLREAWIEGPTGGCGRDSTRNESGLEREMNMTSRPLECVYARGVEAPGEFFCVCGVCVGMCGCEKIMRRGAEGVSPREVRWVEVRPFVRFRPAPHWSARDAFRETHG